MIETRMGVHVCGFEMVHEHWEEAFMERYYDKHFYLDMAGQIMGLCDEENSGVLFLMMSKGICIWVF